MAANAPPPPYPGQAGTGYYPQTPYQQAPQPPNAGYYAPPPGYGYPPPQGGAYPAGNAYAYAPNAAPYPQQQQQPVYNQPVQPGTQVVYVKEGRRDNGGNSMAQDCCLIAMCGVCFACCCNCLECCC